MEKGVLKNFAKFTGKHLCWSLFFDKVGGLMPSTMQIVFQQEFTHALKEYQKVSSVFLDIINSYQVSQSSTTATAEVAVQRKTPIQV